MTTDNPAEDQKLTLITTHINADFDAVGSMLAAHKLYPGSLVVFPGFYEKSMKNFIISSMAYLFNMFEFKNIDSDRVARLVVVDTKQPSRIGELEALLSRPDIEIHIYDHHPSLSSDISASLEVSRQTGANVTMLVDLLREKKIEITPDEATIMCLGIFEDTGSFTYPSTTEHDFMAAAYLRGKGANLATISDLISKEMDPRQIALLNDLLRNADHYNINGYDVVLSVVSCDEYVPDMAFLVQKMLRIENLNALFAIVLMKNKIYVAARSRTPEINVGAAVRELGGGGHSFAAAATIRKMTLAQTENRLLEILQKQLQSVLTAKDIMSSPPIMAEPDITCRKARKLLSRYNVNALLVVKTDKKNPAHQLKGFISRQVIEKALYHKLDDIAISEYMTSEFASVGPDAGIEEIQDKIIGNNQRILPVTQSNVIVGVITRTDLLNSLIQDARGKTPQQDQSVLTMDHPKTKKVLGFMKERLSGTIMDMLRDIGEVAEEMGFTAYVVGGFVRDLFLYRHNEDIDIVIEGNGIAFAETFARKKGLRINAYAKFGTAVVIFPDGFKIDIASSRMEYYQFPAALPTVEMSSIKLDLYRRDFTINTLAICLNADKFGQLIDFFGGRRDLKEGVIRILHNLSFVEDPTRVFRAVRFEQRFGFIIGKLTAGLIENAVKMDFFKRLSGRRVFSEISHLLKEENPISALLRLKEFDLLKVIDPSITLDRKLTDWLISAKKVLSWYDLLYIETDYMKWSVYFLILIRHADRSAAEDLCTRFELSPRYRKLFIEDRAKAEECLALLARRLPMKNSELYNRLKGFRTEILLFMMAVAGQEKIKKAISLFVTDLQYVRVSVTGKDIKKLGVPPSPLYGKIFRELLSEKLDGRIQTIDDEIELIKQYADT
ncbi:MAG: CBS domain-containing protein [Thermodesulfobacteriota bacterium]